ncbi:enoyl-CoA hydratase/isomerase family protein [Mammaliicoccus sp. Dog046]|uniref:enoyl-CoA hydratase/isomerase family protein n=1 Tax=Mammaliicoccus sp. Dog046 TaxID=3034233 RepID=UPI002B263FC5|nr:enoyl-CoA hydratase-related protein [Mammaliicoccus sp. Dog046]WQK84662.1 enoyl-CoA hydratase-related protein [Mammaliicoccus sp. Dog046]
MIETKIENQILFIQLNHGPVNALNEAVLNGLIEAIENKGFDPNIKVIVIKGNGKCFSAGADIKSFPNLTKHERLNLASTSAKLFRLIKTCHKPVISSIHGVCLGGGFELALACDMRIITQDTKVGLPEINLGIFPGFGGVRRLSDMVGQHKALQIALTGENVNLNDIKELFNDIVKDEVELDQVTLALAQQIASKSADSIKVIKQMSNLDLSLESDQIEERHFVDIIDTENAKEGIDAFISKRKPQFK